MGMRRGMGKGGGGDMGWAGKARRGEVQPMLPLKHKCVEQKGRSDSEGSPT